MQINIPRILALGALALSAFAFAGTPCPDPQSPVPIPDTSCGFIPSLNPWDPVAHVTDSCDKASCGPGDCVNPGTSAYDCTRNTDVIPVPNRTMTVNTSSIPWTCACVNSTPAGTSNIYCQDGDTDFSKPCNYYRTAVPADPTLPGNP